jgi:hypothetical protein
MHCGALNDAAGAAAVTAACVRPQRNELALALLLLVLLLLWLRPANFPADLLMHSLLLPIALPATGTTHLLCRHC